MTQFLMVHPGPLGELDVTPLDEGYTLGLARADDAAELAALMAEAYEEQWDEARVLREFLATDDVPATWIVTDSVGIVAVASERLLPDQYPGAGYVHYVGVLKRARGHRLGSVVTSRCVVGFRERGLATAVLETDDFRVPAVVTYLRLGFIPSYRSELEQHAWSALFPTLLGARA